MTLFTALLADKARHGSVSLDVESRYVLMGRAVVVLAGCAARSFCLSRVMSRSVAARLPRLRGTLRDI